MSLAYGTVWLRPRNDLSDCDPAFLRTSCIVAGFYAKAFLSIDHFSSFVISSLGSIILYCNSVPYTGILAREGHLPDQPPIAFRTNMTDHEARSQDCLNLSWPHSITYHVDIARPDASSRAEYSDRGGQESVTTYNGVPRECVKNSQPLLKGEIRVLDLKAGTSGTPLQGSLRKVTLSDSGGYEPLSYTWDDDDTVQPSDDDTEDDVHPALFLLDTNHYLNLKPNCARALYSARKSTTDRTIWVDSICVNQDDLEERSHQVDLMKTIYATTFNVIVYLGRREPAEHDSSSRTAMELLSQPDRLQEIGQIHPYEVRSLERLFERRYFRRLWIVQEVALAKKLEFHCGSSTSHVSELAGKPLEVILGSQVTPPWLKFSKQTSTALPRHDATSQAEQILGLLFDTALCECKDNRDRIFALLSLLDVTGEEDLRADYTLSTEQAYSGLAAYLATNGFLRDVLLIAQHSARESFSALPSWVPNWNNLYSIPSWLQYSITTRDGTPKLDGLLGISSSGVMTIRGMRLGTVTSLGNHQNHAQVDEERDLTTHSPAGSSQSDNSGHEYEDVSEWRLASLNDEKTLESWGCQFKFVRASKQSRNAHHVAFMLPDYLTLLILRSHDNSRDQYTLAELGSPRVIAKVPEDWEMTASMFPELESGNRRRNSYLDLDDLPEPALGLFKPIMIDWKKSHQWATILPSKEAFPRLSEYPRLWSHNPLTSTMTLTHKAIQQIRSTNMNELDLLESWKTHASVGMQILSDKTRLRHLIDELDLARHDDSSPLEDDYRQTEEAARLEDGWSLDDFLGLFIRDPLTDAPMEWPNVQPHGGQALDEVDALLQLMQWARVTRQYLDLLRHEMFTDLGLLGLLKDLTFVQSAVSVGRYQVSAAAVLSRRGLQRGPGRTSLMLEWILHQYPDESSPRTRPVQRARFKNECYWDWRRFNTIIEQRLFVLDHIQPEVRQIQADLSNYEPDIRAIPEHQILAAHGFDPSKNVFTQVQIR